LLADERARKREALLRATEAKLPPNASNAERSTVKPKIGLAVGAVRDRYKMSKHIELEIDDDQFAFSRKAQIAEEVSLDGMYIQRTTVDAQFSAVDVVRSYKELAKVERAFRTMKKRRSGDPSNPSPTRRPCARTRVLVHAGIHLEWHQRKAWAPLPFADENPQVPDDPVTQSTRSAEALRKSRSKTA